jgi:hypothetical protein
MVRHHHETTGKPPITQWAVQEERREPLKRGLVVEDADTAIHTEREQIRNVPVAVGPYPMETTQPARGWFVGREAAAWGHAAYIVLRGVVGRVP